jgi:hypothetical protein
MTDNYNARSEGDAATKKFVRPPAFYDAWMESEGIPIHNLFHVDNLMDVELGPWERFGVEGAFVNMADPFITSAMMLELPPGGQTKPQRHMFETWVFV